MRVTGSKISARKSSSRAVAISHSAYKTLIWRANYQLFVARGERNADPPSRRCEIDSDKNKAQRRKESEFFYSYNVFAHFPAVHRQPPLAEL